MARRHIWEGEDRILHLRDLVEHLEATRSPLAEESRALLAEFKSLQVTHETHLAMILEEIQTGRRDADGNLLPMPH